MRARPLLSSLQVNRNERMYGAQMTADGETQDQPIMDGATEATEQEKRDGREEQRAADSAAPSGNDPESDEKTALSE